MTLLTPLLAFLAGVLTILSPCVLPLAPILASGAVAQHRLGPAALAIGLAASFSLVGLFLATLGFAIGLDAHVLRLAGAALMFAVGAVLGRRHCKSHSQAWRRPSAIGRARARPRMQAPGFGGRPG